MSNSIDRFYTPQLPLSRGDSFDYEYIRDVPHLVKQNLKNILLTIPGERSMDPDFGVGISKINLSPESYPSGALLRIFLRCWKLIFSKTSF